MDPATTAVVACDFQNFILSRYDESHREALVSRARAVLDAARDAGYLVAHVAVRFRPGHAEASERNKMFGAIKRAGVLVEGSDGAAAHPAMAPQPGEPVVVKRRVGAFSTTDLGAVLRARGVTHLVLLGVSTSGVILSTVRDAADADYKITVIEDCCTDADEEVHRVLTTKVFPRQADVVGSAAAMDDLRVGAALTALAGGHPSLPASALPPPLRGCDGAGAGAASFAHRSVVERLPLILRDVVERNLFPPDVAGRVLAVAEAAERGQAVVEALPPLTGADEEAVGPALAAACAAWLEAAAPLVGCNWQRVPWWFLENYAYHWLLLAAGFLRPSAAPAGHHPVPDPFAPHKQAALTQAWDVVRSALLAKARRAVAEGARHGLDGDAWAAALLVSLWANRFDLSLSAGQAVPAAAAASLRRAHGKDSPSGSDQGAAHAALESHLVADDRDALAAVLAHHDAAASLSVGWVVDNCGVELLGDLAAAATLLAAFPAASATIYCKATPTFVSDATGEDVERHIAWLEEQEESGQLEEEEEEEAGASVSRFLRSAREAGRLQVQPHPFLCGPHAFWRMPRALLRAFAAHDLLVVKGDANYRRLLGDLRWPSATPFTTVVSYMPCPVAALRTCKSEVVLGVPGEVERAVQERDPDWLTNGAWGVVQLAE